jgi:hypothetical protein
VSLTLIVASLAIVTRQTARPVSAVANAGHSASVDEHRRALSTDRVQDSACACDRSAAGRDDLVSARGTSAAKFRGSTGAVVDMD